MTPHLSIQYLTDEKGEKTAVLISFKDWQLIQKKLTTLFTHPNLKEEVSPLYPSPKELSWQALYGAWEDEKSAEELIKEIKAARLFNRKRVPFS